MSGRSARASNVFINMPLDSSGAYRDLLVAYVAGLSGLGFTPRCVLEVLPNENRLVRLHRIMSACASSVHELSCVGAKPDPRYNMPFELGMVVGRRDRHQWFVFEAERYRLQRTLSDINGHDPLIHGGKPERLLAKLRDIFRNTGRRGVPTVRELKDLLTDVTRLAERIEDEQESLISRQAFADLVVGAQDLARRRGLI